ncbi:hypothetical protein HanRHA438_Chr04g0186131 [Helianthus annuus]|nr:hypothetical protein HanRHA438_Chr04g0186131 [Helianthus annuus]
MSTLPPHSKKIENSPAITIRSSLRSSINVSSFSISEKSWCSLNSPAIVCFRNLFECKD